MTFRLTFAAVLAAATLQLPTSQAASASTDSPLPEIAVESKASAASDSLAPGKTATESRDAYQTAWDQREAGDFELAVRTSESAMVEIEAALAGDPDASRRRELVELHVRLSGVRDAARRDLERKSAPPPQPKEGNKDGVKKDGGVDAQVLNAPAVEDVRLQFNADVHRYIEFFTGGGRSTFEKYLRRSGRYMKLFREVLHREGMPQDLVHLVFVESGFNVHAKSVSAAVGPWQFLRSTGRLWGLTVNQWVDERKDPEKSTVAAARYLNHLYKIFGDWPLALASYNAGEGTLLRAIKAQGTTNYWDLKLPRETENYVPQFMAALAITREPERYGFKDVDFEEPVGFDEMCLKGAVDLRAIARLADCRYEELRDLNPAVRGHASPGKDGVTTIRVPEGKAEKIMEKLQDGASLPSVDLSARHRVRRGETLQSIANHYRVDATTLARDNAIGRNRPLKRGTTLTVRSHSRARVEPAQLEANDPRASTDYVPPRKIGVPAALDGESDAEGRLKHTVKKGETIASIAAQYGVTAGDIRQWNRLQTSSVRRGTRLKIRTGDAAKADLKQIAADSAKVAAFTPPRSRKHRSTVGSSVATRNVIRVQAGDTLEALASRHGTTVAMLKRANGLTSSRIRTGQRLKIPA